MSEEVLIVDDTPANIEVLRGMLEAAGVRISAAPSGNVALRIAPRLKPALILLDVMMPELSGYETCQRLRANPDTAAIPIIFVTAKSDMEDIVQGFQAGANDYIAKPFRREEVCARVHTHLALHRRSLELQEQGERLRAIVNNIADGILIFDSQGKIRFLNPAAEYQFGCTSTALLGADLDRVLEPAQARRYLEAARQHPHAALHGYQEATMRRRDGEEFTVDLAINPAYAGEPLFVGIFRDASGRKHAEDALRQLALTDALTNVGNRRYFDLKLDEEVRRHHRHGHGLALLLIDIDHFKAYNDHYGHQAGDHCLREVAASIKCEARRPGDLVARYGGEEFAMLLPQIDQVGAVQIAAGLVAGLELRSLAHAASPISPVVTFSVGVAYSAPGDTDSHSRLLARADQALYAAKQAGRNRCALG
jgi:diguanylate cyclase (GGDEF)-like protein/PAS domain S-box-containing protein